MKSTENMIESTITYTLEVTHQLPVFEDWTKEELVDFVVDAIEGIFPTALVNVKNLKVFEGTEGGHE
mgnify:CR=1 FL=1